MKFRVWLRLIISRITHLLLILRNSAFYKWVDNSLIYNLFKAVILVICVLWAIFLLSPNSAHIYYTPEEIQSINVEAESIVTRFKTDGEYDVRIYDETNIYFDNDVSIFIGGDVYNGGYINICPLPSKPISPGVTLPSGLFSISPVHIEVDPDEDEMETLFSDGNKNLMFSCFSYENGKITKRIFFFNSNGESSIYSYDKGDNSDRIDFNFNEGNSSSTRYFNGFYTYYDESVRLEFHNTAYYVIGDKKIDLHTCYVMNKDDDSIYSLHTDDDCVIQLSKCSAASYILKNSSTISMVSSGVLNFSYTPDGKQYTINDQSIYLKAKNKRSLEVSVNHQDNKVNSYISGYVDNATISEMNLFPTFTGWYRDNIFLAPLTLLTTVFGGVALMNKKKK